MNYKIRNVFDLDKIGLKLLRNINDEKKIVFKRWGFFIYKKKIFVLLMLLMICEIFVCVW